LSILDTKNIFRFSYKSADGSSYLLPLPARFDGIILVFLMIQDRYCKFL